MAPQGAAAAPFSRMQAFLLFFALLALVALGRAGAHLYLADQFGRLRHALDQWRARRTGTRPNGIAT